MRVYVVTITSGLEPSGKLGQGGSDRIVHMHPRWLAEAEVGAFDPIDQTALRPGSAAHK